MSNLILITLMSFGIIAGSKATTDGYVYLGHNEDIPGLKKMLNIYNVPSSDDNLAGLWFEFPGRIGDSYVNEKGVCIVSNETPSKEKGSFGTSLYEAQTKAFRQAKSAKEAVLIIGSEVRKHGCKESGRTYLIADSKEGWVLSVVKGKLWVAQRVPDDEIMTITDRFNIGEIDLNDHDNFLGSEKLVRKARWRGWYKPRRDGVFNFAKAYSDNSHQAGEPFSKKPEKKVHRRDLSKMLAEPPIHSEATALTTIFTLNPAYPPEKGTVIWVGLPGQDAANQNQWTIFTKSPDSCHRYNNATMALDRHFKETICTFLILVDSGWSLSLKEVDSGLTLFLV